VNFGEIVLLATALFSVLMAFGLGMFGMFFVYARKEVKK